jgi:hypothetical protein
MGILRSAFSVSRVLGTPSALQDKAIKRGVGHRSLSQSDVKLGGENIFTLPLQRQNTENSKKVFPEKELCGLPLSDLYFPWIGLPIQQQENM